MSEKCIDFVAQPVPELYGINSFNDATMRERLPKPIYKEFKKSQKGKTRMTPEVAEVVANAMKDWALERGATHFTHWFQPLTEFTAEKHDSFINPTEDGRVMMEFSGKELIQGEPDASSFPNGGLRETFEARGYTAWDTTSPAFLKEDKTGVTLYIPTAFFSYTGDALDKKTPLLRSMEALSTQTIRVLRELGNTTANQAIASVGPEQEYFLVDKEFFDQRPDLMLTGRTVFGSMPAKGQEMDDHYFGSIKERVADFMRELNYELWKLGISAKTQHNEVAPNQFELAPIYNTCNVATDHNQLMMDTIKKVAGHHQLEALLHEKPFAGVNGSGKHNNWSLGTDEGKNLLTPGDNPENNMQFLLFLVALITAADRYAPLLRMSATNAGNAHRLGANEAPPAIISVFLGDQLTGILDKLAAGETIKSRDGGNLELGANCIPLIPKDMSDRNRTSPLAFTGNKFEFRMVGSSQSTAGPNVVLNTAMAEVLSEFADYLAKADDKKKAVKELIINNYKASKKVIFNGNGYSDEWIDEAAKRGLPNIAKTVDALAVMTAPESAELFTNHGVFTASELASREEIYLEKYCQQINIEAGIMAEMARRSILPASSRYIEELARTITAVSAALDGVSPNAQIERAKELQETLNQFHLELQNLEGVLAKARKTEETHAKARVYQDEVFPQMALLRGHGDKLETLVDKSLWPFPSYTDMLFCL